MSMINKLSDKADEWLRRICGRLTPGKRLAVILTMLLTFSFLSIYMTVSSIYNMGRRDAEKEMIEIEHIRDLDLPHGRKDSLQDSYKYYDYGIARSDTAVAGYKA
nr:TraL conjugative transposon family protein [Bacteroides fragilis]